MPATGPRAHPDHDLLADLAAQVLPDDLAARIRAHVDRCDDCADLLTQAEGMRSLLCADDPGPMPAGVAARLDDVLAQLRAGTLDLADTEPDDPQVEARWNAVAHEPIVPWDSRPVRRLPASQARGRVTRLRRAGGGGPAQERRTALDEQRFDERPGRWRRRAIAAAAAVVVVGGGGALVRAVGSGSFGEVPTSAGASADAGSGSDGAARPESASEPNTSPGPAAKAAAVVLQTGTNYTDAAFATQARQLITAARTPSSAAAQDQAPEFDARSGAAPTGTGTGTGNQTLRDPGSLQACLTALGATSVQPVAVDLARYQGRDSAVVVLREAGGTYDVWVVARDCRPGADGTLKYVTVPP